MDAWNLYESIRFASGENKRDMLVQHAQESITRRLLDSPACKLVTINDAEQMISVAHTEEMDTKRICAIPGESLPHGGLVDFAGHKWLITTIDANNEIYERGLMTQCNHVLRWISKDGNLKEKWCIVEDGTKYLIGEKRTLDYTIGEARIAVTIGKDEDTVELSRGKRFLIDDDDAEEPTAYEITKTNRLFNSYNGSGVFRFILTETPIEDGDHIKMRIANYADWKPEKTLDSDHRDSARPVREIVEIATEEDAMPDSPFKEVWL